MNGPAPTAAGRAAGAPDGRTVLVATTNAGKLRELLPVLAGFGLSTASLLDFPEAPVAPEDEDSFRGNALAKARFHARATGLIVLADDSGLQVDALGGAPGVHSARYAGPDADDAANRARLLAELAGREDRGAAFVCVLCLLDPAAPDAPLFAEGRCRGTIGSAPRGTAGFGYDPLFVPDDPAAGGRTFAELDGAAKQSISHRGRALAALAEALAVRAGGLPC